MRVKNHGGMHICTLVCPEDNWNGIYLTTYWIQIIPIKDISVFSDNVMTFLYGNFMVLITWFIIICSLSIVFSRTIILSVYCRIVAVTIMNIIPGIT